MWFWWIVSLIILTGSIAFALYNFFGSYKSMPLKKNNVIRNFPTILNKTYPVTKQQVITSLKLKLQAVENNSLYYFNELKKLQQRIQTLENRGGVKNEEKKFNPAYQDENWEELYYEKLDEKEKLENQLDLTTQKLEEAEYSLYQLQKKESQLNEKQSELEMELNKAASLQNKIGELQRELEGAAQRENELKQQIEEKKNITNDFELLQQQYAHLQSEADELQNRIRDITNKDVLLQKKLYELTELESNLQISEYEKTEIRRTVEDIIVENEALAAKLQELQEKLGVEKYV